VDVYKCFEASFFTLKSETFRVNGWAKFCMKGYLGSLCMYVYFEACFFRQKSLEKALLSFLILREQLDSGA